MANEQRRFMQNIVECGECWVWTGCCLTSGHPEFRYNGRSTIAYRAAWQMYRGELPKQTRIGHSCGNQMCVKPSHLRLLDAKSRFFAMVNKTESCWLWLGSSKVGGYGSFALGATVRLAHRVSWEMAKGAIPEGMDVLHRCDIPACVNPDHLFLGTQADNVNDMISKGRHWRDNHKWDGISKMCKNGKYEGRRRFFGRAK